MKRVVFFTVFFLLTSLSIFAQTTEFTYQGRLLSGSLPANGNYDFEFTLFDAETDGNILGTVTQNNISVSNGTFSVRLDFGANFPGDNRYLEIKVKQTFEATFTTLDPRQKITSSPYSYRSNYAGLAGLADLANNAIRLNGIESYNFVLTNDPRMTDARTPLAGSDNYIQNSTIQQSATNFNIGGNGTLSGSLTANIVAANTQYNLSGGRFISNNGTDNTFVGTNTGLNIDLANGTRNSFFGNSAGASNTFGTQNSFFGNIAGTANTIGSFNSFFGRRAGASNTSGGNNTFIGLIAGLNNITGNNNTIIGAGANTLFSNQNFSTAIGAGAIVESNNTIVLGRNTGEDTVRIPGNLTVIGTLNANLPTGSTNYIQNTTTQQTLTNFNISGNGTIGGILTANTVETQQYKMFGNRVLFSTPSGEGDGRGNTFVGAFSGMNTTVGGGNTFIGVESGFNNSLGNSNTMIGLFAGIGNTIGNENTFVGVATGRENVSGNQNTFVGNAAGRENTNGGFNSYFGVFSGTQTTQGSENAFFGFRAGYGRNGSRNSIFGAAFSTKNETGTGNSIFGYESGFTGTCNSCFTNNNSFFGAFASIETSDGNYLFENITLIGANTKFVRSGNQQVYSYATAIGAGAVVDSDNTIVLGRSEDSVIVKGNFWVNNIDSIPFGATPLCYHFGSGRLVRCDQSINAVNRTANTFSNGLKIIKKLRPVTFKLENSNSLSVALTADNLAESESFLVNRTADGAIDSVNTNRVGVVLVSAVQEQQQQIEAQQKQIDEQKAVIERQQKELDALKALVCSNNPTAEICKVKEEQK